MTIKYRRTKKALEIREQIQGRSRNNDWDLILSAAADAAEAGIPIVGDANISNVMALNPHALVNLASGEPLTRSAVRDMMSVGRWAHEEATDSQIAVFRQYGWTVISQAVRSSASPESVIEAIDEGVTTHRGMTARFGGSSATTDLPTEKLVTDAEVEQAARLILRARAQQSAGLYEPGPTAALLLTLVRPEVDWDSELMQLTNQAS